MLLGFLCSFESEFHYQRVTMLDAHNMCPRSLVLHAPPLLSDKNVACSRCQRKETEEAVGRS